MTIAIVGYDARHLSALTELWVEAWRTAYPTIDFERRRGWFAERLTGFAADGVAIPLALVDGKPAGFITVDPATGWIDQMLVGRAFQGTALGSLLMAEAKRLRPQGLSLDVNADNGRAIAFYRREGFRPTGGRFNDQGAAIDLMAWDGGSEAVTSTDGSRNLRG